MSIPNGITFTQNVYMGTKLITIIVIRHIFKRTLNWGQLATMDLRVFYFPVCYLIF